MSIPQPSDPLFYVLVVVGVALVAAGYYWWTKTPGRAGGGRKLGLYLFTRARSILYMSAESAFGMASLPGTGFGSFAERPAAILYERTGRPWVTPRDVGHAAGLRRRDRVLIVRELDPAPLDIGAGRSGRYQGPDLTGEDVLKLKAAAERSVTSMVAQKGDKADRTLGKAFILAYVAVGLCAAAWAGVWILGIMNKGGA